MRAIAQVTIRASTSESAPQLASIQSPFFGKRETRRYSDRLQPMQRTPCAVALGEVVINSCSLDTAPRRPIAGRTASAREHLAQMLVCAPCPATDLPVESSELSTSPILYAN